MPSVAKARMKKTLSPLKTPRKPWNLASVCTLPVQARKEPDWMKMFLPGCRSKEPMSPGELGARLTRPPLASAAKVLTDSHPRDGSVALNRHQRWGRCAPPPASCASTGAP